jgi:hypothetical protein
MRDGMRVSDHSWALGAGTLNASRCQRDPQSKNGLLKAPPMDLVEKIARMISEQDREEAGEAADFVDWHWEERADLAREIIKAVQAETPMAA